MHKFIASPAIALSLMVMVCSNASADPKSTLADAGMKYTDKGWGFSEVAEQDWSNAEKAMEAQVAEHPEDPFRLLNLAYVYTKTDKSADAVAVYERILDLETNPMATLTSGEDVRAKKVARDALASLGVTE